MLFKPANAGPTRLGRAGYIALGIIGSCVTAYLLWTLVLTPLRWPAPRLVLQYFGASATEVDTYKALLATGLRATMGMSIGFVLAVVLATLTGRTRVGWVMLFFLLMMMQKIPGLALVHVFVKSRLGIGMPMTVTMAAMVVTTFCWMILHHRAKTLDSKQVFTLRVVGMSQLRAVFLGLLPHFGSAIGGAARMAMAVSLLMCIVGEWQGVWDDVSLWRYGVGVSISRSYDAVDSQARVLAGCMWLGVLGIILDAGVQGVLTLLRRATGVELKR